MYLISRINLPRVTSWAEAKACWERSRPTAESPHERYLYKRDKTKLVVREPGDSFSFRLHKTDCVTYHADGRIDIRSYDSRSTAVFIDVLTPSNVAAVFSQGRLRINNVLAAEYHVAADGKTMTFSGLRLEHVVRRKNGAKPGQQTARMKQFIALRQAHWQVVGAPFGATTVHPARLKDWSAPVMESWHTYGLRYLKHVPDEALLATALALDGCLEKVPVPLGELPKPGKYQYLSWML